MCAYDIPSSLISVIWKSQWQNPCGETVFQTATQEGFSCSELTGVPGLTDPYVLGENGRTTVAGKLLQGFKLVAGCRDTHGSRWCASVDWWVLSPKKAVEYQLHFSNRMEKTICMQADLWFCRKQIYSPIAHLCRMSRCCHVQGVWAKMHLQALVPACRRALQVFPDGSLLNPSSSKWSFCSTDSLIRLV